MGSRPTPGARRSGSRAASSGSAQRSSTICSGRAPSGPTSGAASRSRDRRASELASGSTWPAPEGLTGARNTFDERAVLQEFAAAAAQGALVSEVRGRAERFAERPDVIRTSDGEMTTAELVDCERRLIAAAVGRAGEGSRRRRCLAR